MMLQSSPRIGTSASSLMLVTDTTVGSGTASKYSPRAQSSPRLAANRRLSEKTFPTTDHSPQNRKLSPRPRNRRLSEPNSPLRDASPRSRTPTSVSSDLDMLEGTFRAFGGGRLEVDGRSFTKLCRDCGLLDKNFTSTDTDLIFAKLVPRGQRRMDLPRFEFALKFVAEKKGLDVSEVNRMVASSPGPTRNATIADAVRFHDDKSTYTGTHVNGGPDVGVKGHGTFGIHVPWLHSTTDLGANGQGTAGSRVPWQSVCA